MNPSFSPRKALVLWIGLLFALHAMLVISAITPKARAGGTSCSVDMNMRVTINVTDVKPKVVFDQLAQNPDCAITVSPFVRKHVTLRVQNATVREVLDMVCSQIGCKHVLNNDHLTIKLRTIFDRWQAHQAEQYNKIMVERRRIFASLLPDDMTFNDVPLSSVLKDISKTCGLSIKPWEQEGDRMVSIDVSGMTVEDALKAIISAVNGEGAVLIKMGDGLFSRYGQHWLWGYPVEPGSR